MSKRSDNITAGAERMPNRSLLRACGLTEEEMNKPIIGIVSAYSEIIPGHINLDKIADAAKAGVRIAGGTPVLVPAIGVCDGIAMGHIGMKYSLPNSFHIYSSYTCCNQRLLCVTHRGLCKQQSFLVIYPFRQIFRTVFIQNLFGTFQIFRYFNLRNNRNIEFRFWSIFIYYFIAQEVQKFLFFISFWSKS